MHFHRDSAPSIDFYSRFGKPILQRYKVNAGLQVSIEYGVDGKVAALEISPPDYRGYNPLSPLELSSEVVDELLENLLPGITTDGFVDEMVIIDDAPRILA